MATGDLAGVRRRAENHPTGAQLRAARALLNLSILELAGQTGLAVNTIKRAEATNGEAPITAANAALLVATFAKAGVEFLPAAQGAGAGVRFSAEGEGGAPFRPRRRPS
jgi:transcriptional regulator with XRE-family HTH domain